MACDEGEEDRDVRGAKYDVVEGEEGENRSEGVGDTKREERKEGSCGVGCCCCCSGSSHCHRSHIFVAAVVSGKVWEHVTCPDHGVCAVVCVVLLFPVLSFFPPLVPTTPAKSHHPHYLFHCHLPHHHHYCCCCCQCCFRCC